MNVEKYVSERVILNSNEHVVVKELWDQRYRVNVWQHDDGIPTKISQSYFVRVSESGVECSPSLGA